MNKKLLKSIFYFLLTVLFLIPTIKANANYTVGSIDPNNRDKYYDWTYKTTGLPNNYTRRLRAEVYYAKDNSSGKVYQSYCVQQNVLLGNGYTTNGIASEKYTSLNDTKKQLIFKILAGAYPIAPQSNLTNFKSKAQTLDPAVALAAQEIVWEIARGERTNYTSYEPKSGCVNNGKCNFYKLISKDKSNNNILKEYKRLIDTAKYTFSVAPGTGSYKFALSSKANIYNMNYSNNKFTLSIVDSNGAFKYFKVNTPSGISSTISSDGKTLTLTSNKALSNTQTITITNKSNSNNTVLFFDGGSKQDITIGHSSITWDLKVKTPKYGVKIKKVSTLDGKALKGAKFRICSDNACKNVLAKDLTTNDNGEVTYSNIPNPGKYYIQETATVSGYELDNTIKEVTITTNHEASTPLVYTFKNKDRELNLLKYTVDENNKPVKLNDGCGTEKYTGPIFKLKDKNGNDLYFEEIKNGEYKLSNKSNSKAVTDIKTCNGSFKIYTLPDYSCTISEISAPEGMTLPSNPNVSCSKNVSLTNGFVGLEFQKKDENGDFVSGGKFAVQRKIDNIYTDILLMQNNEGNYYYDSSKDESDGAQYIFTTNEGIALISKLPPGEYRIVEKEAPEGYQAIKDKDSKALVTIKDSASDYYLVEMINQKVKLNGSEDAAELIVTIITGRKVLNYALIFGGLIVLLVALIIIRKKLKK